ncbi:MAG: phosphatase PAP2 family protein [Caldimonas sp.]
MSSTVLSLLLLIVWDIGGADLDVVRLFAGESGFYARDHWLASTVLHTGGRWLGWSLAALLVVQALRTPAVVPRGPNRGQRLLWLGLMLFCAVAVPVLKRFSATSCPWDLAEFGGAARYLSHWHWGLADGGPGHCFPSGHAVAAFAFFAMYFLWRDHDRARARAWLYGVMVAGALFGTAQLVRGAHYPSHTLWTAWICWAICACVAWALKKARPGALPQAPPAPPASPTPDDADPSKVSPA